MKNNFPPSIPPMEVPKFLEQRSFISQFRTEEFYIFGSIESCEHYVDMITFLENAVDGEIAKIYLNTPGGHLDTAISLIHSIQNTQATVIVIAHGQVASAGTMLFFACQNRIVMPYSHFMFHDGSYGGAEQKFNEHVKYAAATHNLYKTMAYDFYCPYFSEDEVKEILEGKDVYLTANEMIDRIDAINNPKPVRKQRKKNA